MARRIQIRHGQIVLWSVWRNYSFTNPSTLAQWNWFWIFNLDSSKGMSFYWCKTLSVWNLLGMWEDSNITCYHIGSKGNTEKLIWIFQIQFKYLLPRVGTSSNKFTQNYWRALSFICEHENLSASCSTVNENKTKLRFPYLKNLHSQLVHAQTHV